MSKGIVVVILLTILWACGTGPVEPVELEISDTCALCKMAISQQQYAAELIDEERRAYKFDDIGCMVQFVRDRNLIEKGREKVWMFAKDYDIRNWGKIDSMILIRSDRIPTPMASGLIAVSELKEANRYAEKFGGEVLRFSDLLK